MTENKNQDFIIWLLGRARTLAKDATAESKQRVQELMDLAKSVLPSEEAEAIVESLRRLMNGQPLGESHQAMQDAMLLRLRQELKDWKIAVRNETEPGPMILGQNAVLRGKSQWHVLATKNSEDTHIAGTHSMQVELASQNSSLNAAIEDVLSKHKELKDLGLD